MIDSPSLYAQNHQEAPVYNRHVELWKAKPRHAVSKLSARCKPGFLMQFILSFVEVTQISISDTRGRELKGKLVVVIRSERGSEEAFKTTGNGQIAVASCRTLVSLNSPVWHLLSTKVRFVKLHDAGTTIRIDRTGKLQKATYVSATPLLIPDTPFSEYKDALGIGQFYPSPGPTDAAL